ncbi:MAG TPA: UDP-2,3-diacylglucosamine diphosphatase [Terriglobales bacterium]|nr:UDP-2,3-diacylglucosamine diphosphatase [Terriglobales bacterium]
MKTPCHDTVILSDLHLGSEVCRAKAALEMLKGISFRRLILLGDIFCDLNFRRLKKEHWQFLSYIRKLSNPKRGVEVVWVEGNHDYGLAEVMSHLVGVEVYQEYEWCFAGMRHLAIHGHQFDRFVVNNRFISNLFTGIHEKLQKVSFGKKRIVGFLERFDTVWLRLSDKVASGALRHAQQRDVARIFCGHTHEAMRTERGEIQYFNTGSWTQPTATYITVDEEGVDIHEYDERADDRYSGKERGEADLELAHLAGAAGLPADVEYEGVPG